MDGFLLLIPLWYYVVANSMCQPPRSDRDALIAVTALVHNMTIVTRNVADFKPMGVQILNPWE
jgi:predicted nucleic acid-binding protein